MPSNEYSQIVKIAHEQKWLVKTKIAAIGGIGPKPMQILRPSSQLSSNDLDNWTMLEDGIIGEGETVIRYYNTGGTQKRFYRVKRND